MVSADNLQLRHAPSGAGNICGTILTCLPAWFGMPDAVNDFVSVSDRSQTVIASLLGEDVGLHTLVKHSPYAADIYVMFVMPEHPRQGVGRAMLDYAERILAAE